MKLLKVRKKIDCGRYYDEEYFNVLLDDDVYELVKYKRIVIIKARNTNYATIRIDNKPYLLHHFINGTPINKFVTDHIDRNGLNNQRSNLRIVTNRQNQYNTIRKETKSSNYTGVCFDGTKKINRYKASIKINGINKHIGYYRTEEEAAEAYNNELRKVKI